MNTEPLQLLEFNRILERIAEFTYSPVAWAEILAVKPLHERAKIEERFALVAEIRKLASLGISLRLSRYDDIADLLELVRPAGAILNPLELALFVPVFRIAADIGTQIHSRTDIPLLNEMADSVSGFPDILEPLEYSIAPDGTILDTASPLLAQLRKSKRSLTARIRKRLDEIVREREVAIFLQDDFITQRNGRWVIPVRMDSKGMVPGVVHDVSNSGETAFMEPIEVIGLVNELENLSADEKAEQIRIIRELTGWIREDSDDIRREFDIIVQLDFLNALARFAQLLQCEIPRLTDSLSLDIRNGRHPLLQLMQIERSGREVVPLNLHLGKDGCDTVLIITGPNTGGKTIAIKSAGLLLLLAQSGIPVPANSGSVFPVTATLLADIGDEQSIEESLSTFSAHIRKISGMIQQADSRSILLLDELGTGTDPVQGAALACGILKDLQGKGCLVLATTHLVDIVAYVHRTDGMVNGSMDFDHQTLSPLYKLTIGEPGQSHALDIARRYGLPEQILATATDLAGRMEAEFYDLLQDLKNKRIRYEQLVADAEKREREVSSREEAVKEKIREIEPLKVAIRTQALQEAKGLVQAARRELNQILEEARRERSRTSREKLSQIDTILDQSLLDLKNDTELPPGSVQPGDRVFLRSLGHDATVLSVDKKHDRLRVRAGNIEMEIPLAGISEPHDKRLSPKTSVIKHAISSENTESSRPDELNLIGCRLEEAIGKLEKFLDSMVLSGYSEARIIHGKGTGVLMKGVREFLTSHPAVEEFRACEPFEGGEGATAIKLR